MSGHVLRYNPQSKAYVRQGFDGKFAPKVMGQSPGQPAQVQKLPSHQFPPKVISSK
jgi:hypothetical protein